MLQAKVLQPVLYVCLTTDTFTKSQGLTTCVCAQAADLKSRRKKLLEEEDEVNRQIEVRYLHHSQTD